MKITVLAICAILSSTFSFAQNSIGGRVTDASNTPLVGAHILLSNQDRATTTDSNGEFVINNLEPGKYTLKVTYVGYASHKELLSLPLSGPLNISLIQENILTDEVIVSATRATDKMPLTFTEVEKEVLEENNMGKDLPYLLEMTPSVVTTSDAGAGVGYTGIRIRGSDATRINVTLNGIPYNDSESQGVYWVDLPDFASSVDNIQVQRGVGTSTNGPGAFGASINIQTTGLNKDPYATIDNAFGSFNTRKHTLNVGTGLINGLFSLDGRISKIASDGYIDRAKSDLTSYYLSAGYYGKKNLLKFNLFSGHETTYQAWYGTPESRVENDVQGMQDYISRNFLSAEEADNLLNSGRTYNYYTYDNEVDDYTQTHYQLIYAGDVTSTLTWNTALHYTRGFGYYEQYKADENLSDYGYDDIDTDLIRRRWLDNDFYGITFSGDYNPSDRLNLIVGGAWNKYEGDHFGEIIWAQNAGSTKIRQRYYDNTGIKNDFNIYAKLNTALSNRLGLFVDVQYRNVYYSIEGIDNDQILLDEANRYNFFNPKAGLTYQLNKGTNVYASFGIGNKEPNRSDFIDSPDDATPVPETLRNLEVGFRRSSERFSVDVNYYFMDYKNQLVLTGELNDVGSALRTNVKSSYRTGLEFIAGIKLIEKLDLNLNATFSNNIIRDFTETIYDYGQNWDEYNAIRIDYGRTSIAFSPNVIAGGSLRYYPIKGMSFAWNHRFVGDQYLDNTGSESRKIDSYYLNDIVFAYSFKALKMKEIVVKGAVYNLFNNLYESNGYTFGYRGGGTEIRENFFYPQAGTNFMIGLTLKL